MDSNVKFDDEIDTKGRSIRLNVDTYGAMADPLETKQVGALQHFLNAEAKMIWSSLGTITRYQPYSGAQLTDWGPVVRLAISQRLGGSVVRASENVPTGPEILTEPSTDAQSHCTPNLSVVQLIQYVRTVSPVAFAERIVRRLQYLDKTSKEEYPDQQPLNPDSLLDFSAYVARHPNIRYPDTVLTHSGEIRASWKRSDQDFFAIEFLGNGDVAFVLFSPDTVQRGEIVRISGYAGLQSVDRTLRDFDIRRWATESA